MTRAIFLSFITNNHFPPCLPSQAPSGLVRKGSLPLSDTASVNSLRRMKRKAPSPPSRTPEDQSESSNETGNLFILFN